MTTPAPHVLRMDTVALWILVAVVGVVTEAVSVAMGWRQAERIRLATNERESHTNGVEAERALGRIDVRIQDARLSAEAWTVINRCGLIATLYGVVMSAVVHVM